MRCYVQEPESAERTCVVLPCCDRRQRYSGSKQLGAVLLLLAANLDGQCSAGG